MAGKNKSSKDSTVEENPATDTETPLSEDTQATEIEPNDANVDESSSDTKPEEGVSEDNEATPDADADADADAELELASDKSSSDDDISPQPEPMAPTPPAEKQVVIRKGGFFPMLLGGIAAAAIGIGAAQYLPEGFLPFGAQSEDKTTADLQATLDEQAARIADLDSKLDTAVQGPDLSGIETAQESIAASVSDISNQLADIESQLSTLDSRLTDVEQRPITEGASDSAVAAYERELRALQDAMAAQRSEIEAMTAEARELEENAEATAQATMRRAALTRIQTALDAGTGFAPALADLQSAGVEVPEALASVADQGVASLTALQESFPDAARRALGASRSVAANEGENGGFSDFLFAQLGGRSLEPKEGNSPDAVLSRAEAALREGRLTDALVELEGLPEKGRAELSDWSGAAAQRLDAIAAAQALGENLN